MASWDVPPYDLQDYVHAPHKPIILNFTTVITKNLIMDIDSLSNE
jgi:hypothetical protein